MRKNGCANEERRKVGCRQHVLASVCCSEYCNIHKERLLEMVHFAEVDEVQDTYVTILNNYEDAVASYTLFICYESTAAAMGS